MGIAGCRGARFFHHRFASESGIEDGSGHAHPRRGCARGVIWPALACLVVASTHAARADDEIQVYNGEIVEVGKWTAQHHFNYAIKGRKEPEFPGGLIPNRTLNGTPEFAYGVTPWFEAGFYVPWAIDKDGYHSNAMKLRTLFVTPDAAKREFFYGLNIEYQYLMPKFAETRWGMELRPIIGWRKGDYEFIMNPIVDLSFGRNGEAVFAPNARLARNFGEDFAIAVEYYTDLGPIDHFLPFQQQGHNIFGVVDFKVGRFDIEFGVGYGLTQGSDRWMTKLMVTTNLFDSPEEEKSQPQGTVKKLQTAKAPVRKAPEKTATEPAHDYSGCHVGGYFGGTAISHLETNDPVTSAGVFYSAPANASNHGAYRIEFKQSPMAGGTLGCNWQAPGSHFVYGAEGETGNLRLRAHAVDPYSNNDVFDSTVIGNWYGALAGRAGWATDRAWFYGKTGVGFTEVRSTVVGGPGLLHASSSNSHAFWVAGGGIDWAWTGNWSLKMEYLFLGLDQTQSVCGPSGGSTYCSSHHLGGVHSTKLGLNYKIF
jgi:opacity protein-like surface antigen